MHRPLTLWQAIKLSDWSGRFLAAAACLAIVVNAVALVLLIATGVLGGGWAWRPGVDILATIALAYIALRYVYWQQRALQAEKFAIGGVIEPTADTALLDTPLFRDHDYGCVIRPPQVADLEGLVARLNDGTQRPLFPR